MTPRQSSDSRHLGEQASKEMNRIHLLQSCGTGFRVGMRLDVVTMTEITTQSSADDLDESDAATDRRRCRLQCPAKGR
jgi:hypothetical protein